MEGIKYLNLIEISLVVIEIRGVENGKLAVPVNNRVNNQSPDESITGHNLLLTYKQYLNT